MKTNIAITCVLLSTLLGCTAALADEDAASTGSHAQAYVKDSIITTKVKTMLAAEHPNSFARIHVDTDRDGVVWLSGTAGSQAAIDKAMSITRQTEGVKAVHSDITIAHDD
jgi:hyperosmotically inducible protein